MRRFLALVVHNWPLKVAAIGLAVLLYVGLVLAQSSKETQVQVPIEVRNQPSGAFLLGGIQYVTSIRYFAPSDVPGGVTSANFSASVDLSSVSPDGSNDLVVPVSVTSPTVRVLDWAPRQISVRLDPLRQKVVPVQVDTGQAPPNVQVRAPIVDPTQVTISGTQSSVSHVVAAVARVRIDPAGLSIDQQVDVVGVDARGLEVTPIRIDPSSVRVKILIGSQLQTKNLPINVVPAGTPAAGFQVASVRVEPSIVSVEGDAAVLSALARIDTKPVSISNALGDVSTRVGLVLPAGVESLGTDTVNVTVTIVPTTSTRTFAVGPVLSGARQDRVYALSTDQVLLTVGGETSVISALKGGSLVATADVDGLGPGTHQLVLKVTLPGGATLVAISPAEITVTISAAPTPAPSSSSPAP